MKYRLRAAFLFIFPAASVVQAGDWPTFGHDPQRTGWAFEERILNAENAANLTLKWTTKMENEAFRLTSLTAPIVAAGIPTNAGVKTVLYVAGSQGTVFALDVKDGAVLWKQSFRAYATPKISGLQGTPYCPNGINATPVYDRRNNILYVISEDGALYGLDGGTGAIRMGPVQFVTPYSKNWSLNLVNDTVYTVLAQGCGGGLGGFYSTDLRDPQNPVVRQRLLSHTTTAGIWGRGGPVIGENGRVYGATADGPFNTATGDYSNSVVAVSQDTLSLADYFLPSNWQWLWRRDLDFGGASPVWFGWRDYRLLAVGGKEGVLFLLDADSLGSKDHSTPLFAAPRLGNDANATGANGIWGGLSMRRDDQGETWLYVPVWGPVSKEAPSFPVTNGAIQDGSIMAFKVKAQPATNKPVLEAAWVSRNFRVPDPVAIANGVIFALATGENPVQGLSYRQGNYWESRLQNTQPAVLYALDARTGKELYNSGNSFKSWVHFSGLAIAEGNVFAVDYLSNVYCFGLGASATPSPGQRSGNPNPPR